MEVTAEYETAEHTLFDVYEVDRLAVVGEVGRNVARTKWLRDHERITLDLIERKRHQWLDLELDTFDDRITGALTPDQVPAGLRLAKTWGRVVPLVATDRLRGKRHPALVTEWSRERDQIPSFRCRSVLTSLAN